MRRIATVVWRYVLPAVLAFFIVRFFYQKLTDPGLQAVEFRLHWEWLIPAAVLYLCAHAVWARFSITLLRNQGAAVSLPTGFRAYYVSQLGKYLPGKVWVILIRMGLLGRGLGVTRTAVGITAFYEAITSMAAGAMVGLLFLPRSAWDRLIVTLDRAGYPLPMNSMWMVLPLALAPVGLVGLNRFVNRVKRWRGGPNAFQYPRVKLHWVILGLVQNSAGWFILGLSLWMTLKGLSPNAPDFTPETYLNLASLNAIAYVFGFIILFMPAGAGARELALQSLLAIELAATMPTETAGAIAVVTAVVLRLLWTAAELTAAGLLYWLAPAAPTETVS